VSFSITSLSGATTFFQTNSKAIDPTSIQIHNAKYGQTTTVVYPTFGQNTNLSWVTTGCTGLKMGAGAYTNVRTATCTVSNVGNLQFDVRNLSTNAMEQTITASVGNPQVTFKTSLGDFVMELNPTAAPKTVDNFLSCVNQRPSFYKDTIFHRVEPTGNYVIQGGGFTPGPNLKTPTIPAIELETSSTSPKNLRYTVGMARTNVVNSATQTQ
jgi:hypothetical protein